MASGDGKHLFQAVENESASSVSDCLQELSNKPEINLKNSVNQRNEVNQTVLHVSSFKLNPDVTQILLEAGAEVNVQDNEGRTPVFLIIVRLQECNCEDCMNKAIRCLTILSIHGASLDIPNVNGITPLSLCAEYRFAECAKALLENGAALGTAKGRAMIEILVERIPAVLETVFDRAVKRKGNKTIHDPEFQLAFDLGVILPPQITLSNQLNGSNTAINQVFPAEQWFTEKYEACEEMTFLKELLDHSENDSATYKSLLRHPLVNVFIDMKWKSLEVLYIFFLTMQILVLAAYSAFICATIFLDCPYDLYIQIQRGLDKIHSHAFKGGGQFNATNIINPDHLCEIGIFSKLLSAFVIICTGMIFLKELQHAMYDIKDYLKDVFNYFQLVGFCSIIFTVIIAWDPNSPLYSFLYPVAAFGVTVSWCQIFVQIGRLPQLAIFVEMFVKISVNFCFCLATYSFLLIGFAMSFSILFPTKPRLLDLPLSLIKVLTMLVGELDYDSLFGDDAMDLGTERETPEGSNATSTSEMKSVQHRIAGHVWYVTFVVFITLVLMNLLVGLAVSDIQGIRKNAEIYVIKRRIRYIAYLEKSLFEGTAMVPAVLRKIMRESVSIARPKKSSHNFLCCFSFCCPPVDLQNCKLNVQPNDRSFKLLSNESRMSIKHWILTKAFSDKTRKCTGRSDSSTGFRQKNIANFRKGSMISFVGQHQLFVKDTNVPSDSERLKRLEFNVQQMDKKMNELDLKLDAILKTIMRPDSPDNVC